VSRSLKERVPFNARTAKSNFDLVCSLKVGTTGGEKLAELKTGTLGGCAFGNFGEVLLAGFLALAMTRRRASARTCSLVFGLMSVTVEFMVLLRVGEASVEEPATGYGKAEWFGCRSAEGRRGGSLRVIYFADQLREP
jgi:hypothetical protein